MTTNDLSQCKNCIYHYTYNGKDMCKQVGDDFYLQWKVEDCPYHTTITSAIKISDEIYRLRAENAALRERLDKAVELPRIIHPNEYEWFVQYQNKYGLIFDKIFYSERAAEACLKELKEKNDD